MPAAPRPHRDCAATNLPDKRNTGGIKRTASAVSSLEPQALLGIYRELVDRATTLLALPVTDPAERQLLAQIQALYRERLQALSAELTAAGRTGQLPPSAAGQLRQNMLEAQVEALLQGHDLLPWEVADEMGGYQAVCRGCGLSVYTSHKALYSILPDHCPRRTGPGGAGSGAD
jgi:hypothetical protein